MKVCGMDKIKLAAATLTLTGIMCLSANAGQWKGDAKGWWHDNGNGTWPANTWQWIDGNNDGIAECYYFNQNGYCLVGTTTPDGYTVNENGAWIVNHEIQNKRIAENVQSNGIADGTYHVSFTQSDVKQSNGKYTIDADVYETISYSKAYVMSIKVGDIVDGNTVTEVTHIGEDVFTGEAYFQKESATSDKYNLLEDDTPQMKKTARYTFPIADSFVLTDNSDLYNGQKRSVSELARNSSIYSIEGFYRFNTSFTVKNGEVVSGTRSYTP